MKYDAVLFDMDGTLMLSGSIWSKGTRDALEEMNIHLTEEEHFSLGGILLHDLLAQKGYGEELIEQIRARRDELLLPLFREEVRWREGAVELLEELAEMPTGIVTSAHRDIVDAINEGTGIRSHVKTIVAYEDVYPRYKPDPYGLLMASTNLNVDPMRCIYIGDQSCDIKAAAAAGMTGVLIRGPHTPPDLHHELEIRELTELKAFLR